MVPLALVLTSMVLRLLLAQYSIRRFGLIGFIRLAAV